MKLLPSNHEDKINVYESMNNAWLALCQQMRNNPDAETQRALNLLGQMLAEVRHKMDTAEKTENQTETLNVEDGIEWFNNG